MESPKKYRVCRRLGAGVYEKCQTTKFANVAVKKRGKSEKKPKALSQYGLQLVEKQKIRFGYGINERQLSRYVREATETKGTPIADKLFELIEIRLDNAVYRAGLAHTRALARQMVSHGHFMVNGRRVTVPSYRLSINDTFSVRPGSQSSVMFQNLGEKMKSYTLPKWLKLDVAKYEATVIGKPVNTESFISIPSVLEFYSR